MVCLKPVAEEGRSNPGFTRPVIVACQLEEVEISSTQFRDVLLGCEEPGNSPAVPIEALDEQFFQSLRSQMLAKRRTDGNQFNAI